jgi:hypothetical protein
MTTYAYSVVSKSYIPEQIRFEADHDVPLHTLVSSLPLLLNPGEQVYNALLPFAVPSYNSSAFEISGGTSHSTSKYKMLKSTNNATKIENG